MSLKEKLLSDMKGALKARDSLKLNTIRGLNSEIKNREIDLRHELGDDDIISIISTQIKKRKEAAALFDKGGRADLCEKENQEMTILQEYLPEQVSEEDLRRRVQEVIAELRVAEMKDLGKVMKTIIPEFKGRADNNQIKNLVTEYLGQ
ncbi:glutamyl-tRNA amidotransferase [Candidatus Nitromaritima sp. SCGC AAA799-A02]|nr:glutamyl-tRNA amidotransferase [Candidatus Nitromaritima sp. SCGC AAA799-A02]